MQNTDAGIDPDRLSTQITAHYPSRRKAANFVSNLIHFMVSILEVHHLGKAVPKFTFKFVFNLIYIFVTFISFLRLCIVFLWQYYLAMLAI